MPCAWGDRRRARHATRPVLTAALLAAALLVPAGSFAQTPYDDDDADPGDPIVPTALTLTLDTPTVTITVPAGATDLEIPATGGVLEVTTPDEPDGATYVITVERSDQVAPTDLGELTLTPAVPAGALTDPFTGTEGGGTGLLVDGIGSGIEVGSEETFALTWTLTGAAAPTETLAQLFVFTIAESGVEPGS